MQVISAAGSEWIVPFTGLQVRRFRKLVGTVAVRGGEAISDGRPGRQWRLRLGDRVLLVAVYWRTNLTMRRIGPLFGISHAGAHRVIDSLGPLLALVPVCTRRLDQVAIVDGTLVPTRDRRVAAPSKNYRYSTNLQVAIDADSRLVIATSDPRPGNHNDTTVYRDSGMDRKPADRTVMADGGYHGNHGVIMPYRKRSGEQALPPWHEKLNGDHRRIRARIEHALAGMKTWKILRDHRRAAATLTDTASGIAHLRNLTLDS
ncbi:transposase family protein [Saccharopolyspora sp. 6M]|uniref:transposase family protein n=1 Tax=Saccharopolyspora sp. 6M TaxID=2877237 RepID=UPI001CD7C6AC|nr:transposase family protein [Saccharopolyspora sp. 6M]MCA1229553.1 transposase family protein [Saccharopolyspora sp. 6M]